MFTEWRPNGPGFFGLWTALGIGATGSSRQTALAAVACAVIAVVLVFRRVKIEKSLDTLTLAANSVAVVDGLGCDEKAVRELAKATCRWLDLWTALYLAVGSIVPMIVALGFASHRESWLWSLAATAAIGLGGRELVNESRRATKQVSRYNEHVASLERLSDALTRP